MKILVTGAKGQVGWELCRQASALGIEVLATDVEELDITDNAAVGRFVTTHAPELIINAAAYTAVDRAESEEALARRINALACSFLANAAAEATIPLLHISTDYVFAGDKPTAYTEEDPVDPQGVYGLTKLEGETLVRAALAQHIILRTAWVFGIQGANFVKTMLRLGAERDQLKVVADQAGCPTFAGDIARALLRIAKRYSAGEAIAWGTYHFCGREATTWHGFAEAIFDEAMRQGVLARRPTVEPIPTQAYPTPAKRPANSVLDCSKFERAFPEINLSDWREGLTKVVKA